MDNIFLLNWKKFFLLILFFAITYLLYSAVSYLRDTEKTGLFLFALILVPVYFAVSILYSLIYLVYRRRKEGME